jgi:hypothetical protein
MAAKTPAAPMSAPTAAVATAPDPLLLDELAPEPEPEALAGGVGVLEMSSVVLLPTLTVYVLFPCVTVCRPSPRAGIDAGSGSSVTTAGWPGWLVTTAGWAVTRAAWPVMTPLASVSVR